MEHIMNFPRLWELEFVGDGREYFCDGEWSFLLGSELGVWKRSLEILSFKPYLCPFLKGWKLCQVLLFMVCLARSWTAKASFLIVRREFKWSWTVGREVSAMMVGRAWGSYPIMRKNGDWLVTE